MEIVVRALSSQDLERVAATGNRMDLEICQERLEWQASGRCVQLLAWRGEQYAGRGTVTWASKYSSIRKRLPGAAEMNALRAVPTGQGTGGAIMRAAEELARGRGADVLGLAVQPSNLAARRFYDRLGYTDACLGHVVDEWIETDDAGTPVAHHADQCLYLTKFLS